MPDTCEHVIAVKNFSCSCCLHAGAPKDYKTDVGKREVAVVIARQLKTNSRRACLIVWSGMFIMASGNALFFYPIFSGNYGFIFGITLAGVATFQLMADSKFLLRKEKLLAAVVLVLFGVAQVVHWMGTMTPESHPRGFDFAAYYVAAKLLSESSEQNPYKNALYPDGRLIFSDASRARPTWRSPAHRYHVAYSVPFIYPPLVTVLMKPLVRLPFEKAYIVWIFLTVGAFIASIALGLSLGGVSPNAALALILGVGVFSYYPIQWDLIYGQVGCFILFCFTGGVWLLDKKHISLSALGFALATLVKLTPALAVPVLIFHRQWRWLGAYLGWLGLLTGFSIWQVGWPVHHEFISKVLPSLDCGTPTCLNTSLAAFVQQLFIGRVPAWQHPVLTLPRYACSTSKVVSASIYFIVLARSYRRRAAGEISNDLLMLSILCIAISPLSWWHHYTLALVPFLYLWCKMPERGDRLLTVFVLLVGSNVVGFCALVATNGPTQIILSGIIPTMAILIVWRHLSMSPKNEGLIKVKSA